MIPYLDFEVRKIYDEKLPPLSKGREADNPMRFYRHFTVEGETARNPNIVLARDLDTMALTWHEVCDWIITPQIVSLERFHRELVASIIRRRRLRFMEVYSNKKHQHYFL